MVPFWSMTPLSSAVQPCRTAPLSVIRLPARSKPNEPERVNSCSVPERTTKNPSPSIMKSVARPVVCVAPCAQFVLMPATFTPRPTWAGLLPPLPSDGAPPARSVWESAASKTADWLL